MTNYEKYRDSILSVVLKAELPIGIETVRKKSGIKVWETAKALLLELLIEGRLSGIKTAKSWVFWIERQPKPNFLRVMHDTKTFCGGER